VFDQKSRGVHVAMRGRYVQSCSGVLAALVDDGAGKKPLELWNVIRAGRFQKVRDLRRAGSGEGGENNGRCERASEHRHHKAMDAARCKKYDTISGGLMAKGERWTPVASAVMALGAIACCLPIGLVGAAGLVSLAAMLESAQAWLLAGAGVLLALAAVQALRGRRSCRTRGRRFSLLLFGLSAAVVVGILAFPQYTADVIADGAWMPFNKGSAPELLDAGSFAARFNAAAGTTRVVLLIAPSCPTCLQGAAEVQRVLARNSGKPVTVLAVWNPILPTDWSTPGARDRFRLTDARAAHFWDPRHTVTAAIQRSGEAAKLDPGCCFKKDRWWDFAAVFPPGVRWEGGSARPSIVGGAIIDVAPQIEASIR
jgi:hypothetical protein